VSSTPSPIPVALPGLSRAAAGSLCCLVSVLGYSAANICMCRLARLGCDPTWAIFNKELVSVLVVGPWLLYLAMRGQPSLPKGRPLLILILVGLATELGGNAGMQWALGVAGLAVMIPANMAFLLVAAAILGRLFLREPVAPRTMAAIGMLMVALALLGLGAAQANPASAGPDKIITSPALVALAIFIALVAGIIFALLSIAIRHCVTGTTRLSAVVLLITGMGVLSLGPISVYRAGLPRLWQTPPEQFLWMFTAGVCNLIAFVALVRGLQLTTVVHVNMLNAGQVALAAIAGVLLFHETPNPALILGVCLTIGGIFAFGRPTDEVVDQHI
jgi:drug/metabolite transporter, DME family